MRFLPVILVVWGGATGGWGFVLGRRKRPVDTRSAALDEHARFVNEAATAHELGFAEQAAALERAAARCLDFADHQDRP